MRKYTRYMLRTKVCLLICGAILEGKGDIYGVLTKSETQPLYGSFEWRAKCCQRVKVP